MKTVGIREVRQKASQLIEEVQQGRELLITNHGKPVARLVPVSVQAAKPLGSYRDLRKAVRLKGGPLSATVAEMRNDRA
jgi:prevent-host-death family protein